MGTTRQLLARGLAQTGGTRVLNWWGTWKQLLVLNYHRIGDGTQTPWDWDLWSATQDDFDWQVRYLKRNFDIVTPADLPQVAADHSGHHVMITFDDGYRDNYELAYPVLRSHGVAATFFLATGFLDHPHPSWWDEIAWMVRHARHLNWSAAEWFNEPVSINPLDQLPTIRRFLKRFKQLSGERTAQYLNDLAEKLGSGRCPVELARPEWMTWDMAREMSAGGMHMGPHTVNHPILARQSPEVQAWEIQESLSRIAAELGTQPDYFSYPVGGAQSCDATTWAALRAQGIEWAFRFGTGHSNTPLADPLQIPRIAVERDYDRSFFAAMVAWPQLFA